jgi:hypothetical protein
MATYNLSPIGNEFEQFFGAAGANFPPNLPLNGGFLNTFQAGTSTPIATFANNLGSIQNSTTMQLGPDGRFAGAIWLLSGQAYKFQLTDSTGFQIWIVDNVSGINDSSQITNAEWIASGAVPTYSSATTFTTPGNTTGTFQPGRRVKATVTAGTVYGTVFTSTFGVSTTIVLTMDTGQALDNGLNQALVGLLGESNPSVPQILPYNTVFFRAHRSSNQTTGTTAIFDVIDSQTGGTNYSNSTGIFTAPFTGWYHFDCALAVSNTGGAGIIAGSSITANSVRVAGYTVTIAAGVVGGWGISTTCPLTAGQTVLCGNDSGFTASYILVSGASLGDTSFCGYLVARTA